MAEKVGSLFFLLGINAADFEKKLSAASARLADFGRRAQDLGRSMSLYVSTPIIAAGGAAIKFASDFEESLNKVDVAFGDSAGTVRDFAKETLKTYGIAQGTALDMAALFGDMATGMGISQDAAAQLSTSMVGLAGDVASFKNMNIKEVTTALNGVFTGETESLKRLGVVMTETNLKQFALEQGITKSLEAMSQGEKVMLRYEFVMAMLANSQGDFARTGGGAANQMRVFQESLKELSVQFGQILLPTFISAIKTVNGWVDAMRAMDEGQKRLVVSIAAVAAAAGPLLIVLGSIGAAMPAIVAGAAAIGTAFNALALGPIGVLVAVMVGLIDTVDRIVERLKEAVPKNKAFEKALDNLTRSTEAAESAQNAFNTAKQSGIRLTKEQAQATIDELKAQKAEIIANRERAEGLLAVAKARVKSMTGKGRSYLPHTKEYQEFEMLRKSIQEYEAAIQTALHSEVEIGAAISEALAIVTLNSEAAQETFKLTGKTVKELEDRYKALSEALGATVPGSKEWLSVTNEMAAIQNVLKPPKANDWYQFAEAVDLSAGKTNAFNKSIENLSNIRNLTPYFNEVTDQFKYLDEVAKFLGTSFDDLAGQKIAVVEDAIVKMIEAGKQGTDEFKQLVEVLNQLKGATIEVSGQFGPLQEWFDGLGKGLQTLVNSVQSMASGLGQALMGNAGDFKTWALSLIQTLLNAASAALLAGELIKLGPAGLITALAGIGILQGIIAGLKQGVNQGPTAFAKGGAVTGPTLALVGENPASRGEAIIPFERMGSFLSQFTGMGMGTQNIIVSGQLAGDVIRLSGQKSEINNNRVRWAK